MPPAEGLKAQTNHDRWLTSSNRGCFLPARQTVPQTPPDQCKKATLCSPRKSAVSSTEINNKTDDLKIELESIQRAKHRRVEAVTFAIEKQEVQGVSTR